MQQIPEDTESLITHSITMERMMAKKVELVIFKLPWHTLQKDIKTKLEELLKNTNLSLLRMKPPLGPHHWPRWW